MEDLQVKFQTKYFRYRLEFIFLGQVSDLKKRDNDLMTTNENEVKSDMIQCAQDLISFWVQDTLYPTLDIGRNFNITTLENELDDTVTGCYVDITFSQSNSYNSCIIPMSGMPPPPSVACEPVVITINGDAYATVQSGGSKAILVQYENGNNVGVINGDIIKIPDPITCADATVDLNGTFYSNVVSGGTLNVVVPNSEISLNGVPYFSLPPSNPLNVIVGNSTVNVNGNIFDTIAPEGTLNVPVQYVNGTAVGTINAGKVLIPNPIVCPTYNIIPSRPILTQEASGYIHDEYWHKIQGTFDIVVPANPIVQTIDPNDVTKNTY